MSTTAAVASVEVEDWDVVAVGSDDDATTRNDGIVEDAVGRAVGTVEGFWVGLSVGAVEGCSVGTAEGVVVGDKVT